MKLVGRKLITTALILVGIILVLWIITTLAIWWPGYKQQKAFDRWQAGLEQPYKEDSYGGKTPEETWAMFLAALKKEDIELASKYFVVEKQGEWRANLFQIKDKNRIKSALNEFETLHKNSENNERDLNVAYFYIYAQHKELGKISSPVVFKLNQFTKVWKISVL